MFSNVGWGEILLIFIVGLIVIGPERLPKVITDVRAMILAARTAIDDARNNLNNEFGEDFDDLRRPLQELGELRKLNPKTAITRTLFDGDDTYLDMLSGKPAAGGGQGTPQEQISQGGQTSSGAQQLAQNTPPQSAQAGQTNGQTAPHWVDPVAQAKSEAAQNTEPNSATSPAGNPNPANTKPSSDAMKWVDDDVL